MGLRRLLAALSLAGLLAGSATTAAHAENWFDSQDACLDLDSVRLVNDAKIGETLVAYRSSSCTNGHPAKEVYWLGVKRRECSAVLKGATSFATFMFRPNENNSWRLDTKGYLAGEAFRGLALQACHKKGAPDGLVEFENELSGGRATVYIDGTQVCLLNSMSDNFVGFNCDVDLSRFGADIEYRHAVRIDAGQREENDTVSISDCNRNWRGTKLFEIMDSHVHVGCM